jgi:hypothetical protein
MRAAILSTVLSLTLASAMACRGSETPDRTRDAAVSTASLDFAYGVDAARPRTSFDLHVPPVGDAELYLGASATPEDTETRGYFRAPVSDETRTALRLLVSSKALLSRSGGPSATAEGSGFLRIASGSATAELSLASPDEGTTALRTKLDEIVADVARHPVRALRMTVGVTRDGATWRPELTLTQVGTEPLAVLFLDPSDPTFCLHASATTGARGATSELTRADVATLVQTKALPGGVTNVAAGTAYHLPLPPLAATPDGGTPELEGSVTFWLPGPGLSRRAVELHARVAAERR